MLLHDRARHIERRRPVLGRRLRLLADETHDLAKRVRELDRMTEGCDSCPTSPY